MTAPLVAAVSNAKVRLPHHDTEGIKAKTLRKVFNLYNTAAMKLNAAEIRNATYQTHPIHKMAFTIAGENSESEIWHLDEEIQRTFTSDWRLLGSTKRFAATELICQYFAYSRPERSPNSSVFKGTSTANSINRFLDTNRPSSEKIGEMAQELVDSYYFAEDYFDLDDGEYHAFERNDKNGLPKFNKLTTITNMVASRMLKKLLDQGIIDENAVTGFDLVSFQKYFKNHRVRFGYFLSSRNSDRPADFKKIVFLFGKVKCFCGPISDCVKFVICSGKILQNFWHCLDRITKHLIPACHPGNNRIAILRACS